MRGHAVACSRSSINNEDLLLAMRVALSSASIVRSNILKTLLKNNGALTISDIMKAKNCSKTAAADYMKELELIGLLKNTKTSK